jgi:GNAT superfamily N-acetyltransferase
VVTFFRRKLSGGKVETVARRLAAPRRYGARPNDGAAWPAMEIRRVTPDDRPRILGLLRTSLGWGTDPRYEQVFAWKHDENPFGPSPAWVALENDRIVGFRTFMRWEFAYCGDVVRAVRAVDTATHPDYQGQGIFRQLTLHALDGLRDDGVAFVFNTPNHRSRPGYLKMGWQVLGRVPLRFQPHSLRAVWKLARARAPVDRWPLPANAMPGRPAVEVFADSESVENLVAAIPASSQLTTRRNARYLAWRYGLPALGYRVFQLGTDTAAGLTVFRLRKRGDSLVAAIVETLWPPGMVRSGRSLARVLRRSAADYTISVGGPQGIAGLRLPHSGPQLTGRTIGSTTVPPIRNWSLTLGDIELF